MNCERYQDALRDTAATNNEPGAKLARHLEHCPRCRAAWQAERELFSRIDNTLRARLNVDPPSSFLARVRAQLAKEAPGKVGSTAVWAVPGAALALVLVAIVYPLVNSRQPGSQQQSKAQAVQAQSAAVTPDHRPHEDFREPVRQHIKNRASGAAATLREPEVLVPPDEQKAFAQFVARVAGRDAMAEAVVRPVVEKSVERNIELPHVPSVDLAGLQPGSFQWTEPIDDSTDSE